MAMLIDYKDGLIISENFVDFEKPSIITGLANDWPAFKDNRWSLEGLKINYGEKSFSCWNCLNIDSPIVNMSMSDFIDKHVLDLSLNTEESMLYLNDKFFEKTCVEMTKDYTPPKMFASYGKIIDTSSFARRVLVGAANTHTYLHVDNLYTSAWNTIVLGKKFWLMIEPKVLTSETDPSEKVINGHPVGCCDDLVMKKGTIPQMIAHLQEMEPERRFVTFVQEAGETVYIPAQWYHAVVNLTATVGVSHAFVQPSHLEKHLQMALGLPM